MTAHSHDNLPAPSAAPASETSTANTEANAVLASDSSSTATAQSPRLPHRHWAHASLFATLAALLGVLVPGLQAAVAQPERREHLSMQLDLPTPDTLPENSSGENWQFLHVQRGQTFSSILEDLRIPRRQRAALLSHADVRNQLTRLRIGTELGFDIDANGQLRRIRFNHGDSERIELGFTETGLQRNVIEREIETRTVVLSGKVGRSLHRSARQAGLSNAAIKTLTDDIFKYAIDFHSDIGPNDRFSVVVEQRWREGELIGTGQVLAATFSVGDTVHSGFLFERNGRAEYFNADGQSLKRSFLRMPIPYARLTSGFGTRRHPIMGSMRQHRGVDYAASTGTPILAAGDARVMTVGWKGGYGRTVELDHGRGHSTLYAHMSRFGNIRPGQRISQGTVIGYVGSSGMSTGPHLHYEFRINGVHRNPLTVTLPPPEPLSGAALAEFRDYTREALAHIREVENIIYQDPEANRVASQDAQQSEPNNSAKTASANKTDNAPENAAPSSTHSSENSRIANTDAAKWSKRPAAGAAQSS